MIAHCHSVDNILVWNFVDGVWSRGWSQFQKNYGIDSLIADDNDEQFSSKKI